MRRQQVADSSGGSVHRGAVQFCACARLPYSARWSIIMDEEHCQAKARNSKDNIEESASIRTRASYYTVKTALQNRPSLLVG